MPLASLEGRLRIPVDLVVATGVKKRNASNKEYPAEVDYFVFPWGRPTEEQRKAHEEKAAQRVDPRTLEEVRALYGEKPKALRCMLVAEWDQVDGTGREVSFSRNNEAWAAGGLKCIGHGEDRTNPDTADCSNPDWAKAISDRTHVKPLELSRGWQQVACWGSDCRKFLTLAEGPRDGGKKMAVGHDEDAACRPTMRLRAMLVHPTLDEALPNGERNPDYLRKLCYIQIGSGSWHAMVGLQGQFAVLRAEAGRSAFVPFELVRPAQETKHGGRTQIHYPLRARWNTAEVQRIGVLHPSRILLPPELLEAQRIAATAVPTDFRAVKHLYSPADQEQIEAQAALPRLSAPTIPPPGGGVATPPPLADPDRDAVLLEAEGDAELTQAERDALKTLVGLVDTDAREVRSAKLTQLAAAACEVMVGMGEPAPATVADTLNALRKRHEQPVRERLQAEAEEAQADPAAALGW
jgi:Recombination directionality factor-like